MMAIWRWPYPLVLASKSKSRLALLNGAGIEAQAEPANIDERSIETASGIRDAGKIASLLAREKARAVAHGRPDTVLVLGADQTLGLGADVFSKPADTKAARRQLLALRGKTHTLYSAIALMQGGGQLLFEHCAEAHMTMRDFSEPFLDRYMRQAGDAVLGSVGCYQYEGLGLQLFERIEGDYFTILGMPLMPLLAFMRARDMIAG